MNYGHVFQQHFEVKKVLMDLFLTNTAFHFIRHQLYSLTKVIFAWWNRNEHENPTSSQQPYQNIMQHKNQSSQYDLAIIVFGIHQVTMKLKFTLYIKWSVYYERFIIYYICTS